MSYIQIQNPHSILAALESRPKAVREIKLPKEPNSAWNKVESLAKSMKVRLTAGYSGEHIHMPQIRDKASRAMQAYAWVEEKASISLDEVLGTSKSPGFVVVLDEVQDPQNLGSIFRTASFFGAKGIIATTERSAPLTSTVYDVSSGGVDQLPFHLCGNLKQVLDRAKDLGYWALGTSEHATQTIKEVALDRPWLVLFGNEERGLRRLTIDNCDMSIRVPQVGGVDSLNVSVACGVILGQLSLNRK